MKTIFKYSMFHFNFSLKINFSSEMGVCFVSCSMFIEPFKITLVFLLHSFVKPTETRMKCWVSSAIIEEILKSTNFTPAPPLTGLVYSTVWACHTSKCTLYNCTLTGLVYNTVWACHTSKCTLYNCTLTGLVYSTFWACHTSKCTLYNCTLTQASVIK